MSFTRCNVGSLESQEFSELVHTPAFILLKCSLVRHAWMALVNTSPLPNLAWVVQQYFWWVIQYSSGTNLHNTQFHYIRCHFFFLKFGWRANCPDGPNSAVAILPFKMPSQSRVTIYLRQQGTSLLISAQLLWSVKQKNNQRLLQRPGFLAVAAS